MKRAWMTVLFALSAANAIGADSEEILITPSIPIGMIDVQRRLATTLREDLSVGGIAICKEDKFFFRVWSQHARTLPSPTGGFEIDWVIAPPIHLSGHPVQMGSSTANNAGCFVGSLGMVVTDTTGRRGYITSSHLAAAGGFRMCPGIGDYPNQYAPALPCDAKSKIGDLDRNFPHLHLWPDTTLNIIDAAFVVSNTVDAHVACTGACQDSRVASTLTFGQQVRKCGAGSGDTTGTVTCVHAQVKVDYACGLWGY